MPCCPDKEPRELCTGYMKLDCDGKIVPGTWTTDSQYSGNTGWLEMEVNCDQLPTTTSTTTQSPLTTTSTTSTTTSTTTEIPTSNIIFQLINNTSYNNINFVLKDVNNNNVFADILNSGYNYSGNLNFVTGLMKFYITSFAPMTFNQNLQYDGSGTTIDYVAVTAVQGNVAPNITYLKIVLDNPPTTSTTSTTTSTTTVEPSSLTVKVVNYTGVRQDFINAEFGLTDVSYTIPSRIALVSSSSLQTAASSTVTHAYLPNRKIFPNKNYVYFKYTTRETAPADLSQQPIRIYYTPGGGSRTLIYYFGSSTPFIVGGISDTYPLPATASNNSAGDLIEIEVGDIPATTTSTSTTSTTTTTTSTSTSTTSTSTTTTTTTSTTTVAPTTTTTTTTTLEPTTTTTTTTTSTTTLVPMDISVRGNFANDGLNTLVNQVVVNSIPYNFAPPLANGGVEGIIVGTTTSYTIMAVLDFGPLTAPQIAYVQANVAIRIKNGVTVLDTSPSGVTIMPNRIEYTTTALTAAANTIEIYIP